MSDERLSGLEARFAWLERHVTEQDRAMLALSEEIRRLREEIRIARERTGGAAPPGEREEAVDERPPHY